MTLTLFGCPEKEPTVSLGYVCIHRVVACLRETKSFKNLSTHPLKVLFSLYFKLYQYKNIQVKTKEKNHSGSHLQISPTPTPSHTMNNQSNQLRPCWLVPGGMLQRHRVCCGLKLHGDRAVPVQMVSRRAAVRCGAGLWARP